MTSNSQPDSELPDLEVEILPTLEGINSEEREVIESLAHTGHPREAEQELLNYVVEEDHYKELRREGRKRSFRDEWFMHKRMYWLALIPTAIALYFIFSLLFNGRLR